MRIIVTPSQLHINPILIRSGAIILLLSFMQETGLADLPLEFGEEDDIGAGGVHFVAFTGMDCLFLDCLDLEGLGVHVEYLA